MKFSEAGRFRAFRHKAGLDLRAPARTPAHLLPHQVPPDLAVGPALLQAFGTHAVLNVGVIDDPVGVPCPAGKPGTVHPGKFFSAMSPRLGQPACVQNPYSAFPVPSPTQGLTTYLLGGRTLSFSSISSMLTARL